MPNVFSGVVKPNTRGRGHHVVQIPHIQVTSFKHGTMTYPEPQNVPRGGSPNALNFLTKGDKIETRNGYVVLGTKQAGTGKVTGMFTAHQWDGTELLYKTAGKSLYLYDESLATPDWVEIGTNLLGTAASGEDVSFAEYLSPSGAQLWISSPNSDLIKIMTANPKTTKSMYNASTNFKGRIRIKQNRMFAWKYPTSGTLDTASNNTIQASYIDKQVYTVVTAESLGTGDGTTKTFNGTLTAVTGKRTCFFLAVTAGSVTFTDNYLGVLTGSEATPSTGTINYTTGAWTLTFQTAPPNLTAVTCTYQWEDSTNTGIADFTRTSPTRTTGQGITFRQSDGGDFLNIMSLSSIGTTSVQALEYCFHERKAWSLVIGADDTTAVNVPYRNNMVPGYWRAMVESPYGIFYVDITNKSRPYFAVLEVQKSDGYATPRDLSSHLLDLTNYSFDSSNVIEFDKYVIWCARTTSPNSAKNNVCFVFDRELETWDVVDYYASVFAIYKGTLVCGDSATINAWTLFSGWDDDGAAPNYLWDFNKEDFGMVDLKKVHHLFFEGEIDINQTVNVYASIDSGAFVLVGSINGTGKYVDRGQAVQIGSLVIGQYTIGGGSTGATAYHYEMKIKPKIDRHQRLQIRVQPQGVGYFSCSALTYWDIRRKAWKLPTKYRS